MLQRDYLVRLIAQFADAVRRSLERSRAKKDPKGAAEILEAAIGEATDIDGSVLLSLSPDSIASIMQVSGVDPRVTLYIAKSLKLEAEYLREAGEDGLARIRSEQADAIAVAYDLGPVDESFDLEGDFDVDELDQAAEG